MLQLFFLFYGPCDYVCLRGYRDGHQPETMQRGILALDPHATPRHRNLEKQCPDSNLGSLFLNVLGIFQEAFFI